MKPIRRRSYMVLHVTSGNVCATYASKRDARKWFDEEIAAGGSVADYIAFRFLDYPDGRVEVETVVNGEALEATRR